MIAILTTMLILGLGAVQLCAQRVTFVCTRSQDGMIVRPDSVMVEIEELGIRIISRDTIILVNLTDVDNGEGPSQYSTMIDVSLYNLQGRLVGRSQQLETDPRLLYHETLGVVIAVPTNNVDAIDLPKKSLGKGAFQGVASVPSIKVTAWKKWYSPSVRVIPGGKFDNTAYIPLTLIEWWKRVKTLSVRIFVDSARYYESYFESRHGGANTKTERIGPKSFGTKVGIDPIYKESPKSWTIKGDTLLYVDVPYPSGDQHRGTMVLDTVTELLLRASVYSKTGPYIDSYENSATTNGDNSWSIEESGVRTMVMSPPIAGMRAISGASFRHNDTGGASNYTISETRSWRNTPFPLSTTSKIVVELFE